MGFLLGKGPAGFLHVLLQCGPFDIIHHQIGGAVFLHKIPVSCQPFHAAKTGHKVSFPAKAAQSLPKNPSLFLGKGPHLLPVPFGQADREKLLDRHRNLFVQIHGQIGDSKAPGADFDAQQIFSLQNRKYGQAASFLPPVFPGKATVFTGPGRIRPKVHTARAQMVCINHRSSLVFFFHQTISIISFSASPAREEGTKSVPKSLLKSVTLSGTLFAGAKRYTFFLPDAIMGQKARGACTGRQ